MLRTQDLQPLPFEHFIDLKDKIEDRTIPSLVDLFDWSRLPPSFHKNIEARHEILFTTLPQSP